MARRLVVAGVLAVLGAMTVVLGPTAAFAEDGPDQITIAGDDLPQPLEVRAEDNAELFAALHREVGWLVGQPGEADKPEDEDTLGPRYVLVVYVAGEATHEFHLYPLAEGGPRAHRPAAQPGDREVDAGWFYARLSMPDTLVTAGVALPGVDGDSGGTGGGRAAEPEDDAAAEAPGVSEVLDEWRRGMLITVGVTAVIVLGLAGAAFAIRRKA